PLWFGPLLLRTLTAGRTARTRAAAVRSSATVRLAARRRTAVRSAAPRVRFAARRAAAVRPAAAAVRLAACGAAAVRLTSVRSALDRQSVVKGNSVRLIGAIIC